MSSRLVLDGKSFVQVDNASSTRIKAVSGDVLGVLRSVTTMRDDIVCHEDGRRTQRRTLVLEISFDHDLGVLNGTS